MATTTTNLGLTLPVGTENVSLSVLNGNMSLIDTFAGKTSGQINKFISIATSINSTATNSYERLIEQWATFIAYVKTASGLTSGIVTVSGKIDFPSYNSSTNLGSYYAYGALALADAAGTIFLTHYHTGDVYVIKVHTGGTADTYKIGTIKLNEEITATAGTNITINWQRCRKTAGMAVVEVTLTTSSSIAANSTILSGLPSIGGNSQHFAAFSDAGTLYPLTTVSGDIKNLTTIGSGVKIRFIVTYYYV